jgi:hypothetical protein
MTAGAFKTTPEEISEKASWLPLPTFGQASLHEITFAFLCLQPLPPRTWWRIRALSSQWRKLLDGHSLELGGGLLPMLIRSMGPLDTANREVDFAGCVYAAVHCGSVHPLQELLRPLTSSWARQSFIRGVAREALIQASVSGEAACCSILLDAHGPACAGKASSLFCGSMAAGCLTIEDVENALREAEDWELSSPGSVLPECRDAVTNVLETAIPSHHHRDSRRGSKQSAHGGWDNREEFINELIAQMN